MTTWAKVERGQRVELRGKTYVVTKIKTKGKRAKVTVVGGAGEFTSEVKLKDTVTIVRGQDARSRDAGGWHKPTKAERKEQERALRPGLPPGDPTVTRRPVKPSGDPWETTRGKAERVLVEVLGAHLVGESLDEGGGYYVPPVDETTVHAHLMVFHGADTDELDSADALALHAAEHEHAGTHALHVNHWHTETRPPKAAKK